MPATTNYERGDVVLLPWTHVGATNATSKRPAVVVSCRAHNDSDPDLILVVLPLTTQLHHAQRHGAVVLRDWQQAGLLGESVAKPSFVSFAKSDVIRTLGKLTPADRRAVMEAVAKVLGFQQSPQPPPPPPGP